MEQLPRLQAVRRSRHLSVTEVAAKSGISRNTIYLLEGGEKKARWPTIRALAEALDVTPEELMETNEAAA